VRKVTATKFEGARGDSVRRQAMNFRPGAPGLANPAAVPHPVERARTLTRMAGVLNQALVKRLATCETAGNS